MAEQVNYEQANYENTAEAPAADVAQAAKEDYQPNGAVNTYAGEGPLQHTGPTSIPPGGRHDTSLTPGKVFIGGLDTNTTKEVLHDYCAAWCVVLPAQHFCADLASCVRANTINS